MLLQVVADLLNRLFVAFGVLRVVGDQPRQTVVALQHRDLLLQLLDLSLDELPDTRRLLLVVHLPLLVLAQRFIHKFLLVGLKQQIQFAKYLLLVLHELVVDTLPESHRIVVQFVVGTAQLLVDNDVLVALLFGFGDGVVDVDVGELDRKSVV